MAGNDGVGAHQQDLIDDEEIRTAENDRLAHEQIATQLAELAIAVPTQSNIALYGSWGSGKSSVANLLRAKLALQERGRWGRQSAPTVRFARFDAFKYAETPLRRNFITAVAKELEIFDDRFHDGLYAAKTSTKIDLKRRELVGVVTVFAVVLSAVIGAGVVAAAILAALRDGGWRHNFTTLADQFALAGLLPATLLTALVSLASKPFQVERKSERPDSDEQFEKLFNDLVDCSGAARLVVFIDELDRCSATTVTTTLDTIRTFFRARNCVFIVAADRRVLEQALTRAEGTQQTPADTLNPYYSTGSAYLDKVFQYQLSLPPLLPHRITRFALDLVETRGGLWSQLNLAYVVSVLVPTHVTSPRRVKHLLNTFALTYRTAHDRHQQKLLAEDPRANAAAIAKLVCLSVEFPLFARDLELDARLPEYVLLLAENTDVDKPDGVTATAWRVARTYASGVAAPAVVITAESDAPADGQNLSAGSEAVPAEVAVTQAHTKQLIDYLTRTRAITGPSRDLVFLHSPGTAFGLDSELAQVIEHAADNGRVRDIADRISALTDAQQRAALTLLVHQITTGIGVGATNAARTLLMLIGADPALPSGAVADAACAAVDHAITATPGLLDDDTAAAAWSLATQGSESESLVLRRRILATVVADNWEHSALFILSNPGPAVSTDRYALGTIVAAEILSDRAVQAIQHLDALDDELLRRVLAVSTVSLQSGLRDDLTAWDTWQKTASETRGEQPFDPGPSIRGLAGLTHARAQTSVDVCHDVWSLLLGCDAQLARNAVEQSLTGVVATSDFDLIKLLLDAAHRRRVDLRPTWYSAIDPAGIGDGHGSQLRANLTVLWTDTAGTAPAATHDIDAALTALTPLIAAVTDASVFDLTDTVAASVASPLTDAAQAAHRSELLDRTAPFVAIAAVDLERLGGTLIPAITSALHQPWPAGTGETDFHALVDGPANSVIAALAVADDDHTEQLTDLALAVMNCSWLTEPRRTATVLAVIDTARIASDHHLELPSAARIADLLHTYGTDAGDACERWLLVLRPPFTDVDLVLDTLIGSALLTADLAAAITNVRSDWDSEDKLKLLTKHLAAHDQPMQSPAELEAIGLGHCDDTATANLLIDRFTACTHTTQRRTVTQLWKAARIVEDRARARLFEDLIFVLLRLDNKGTPVKTHVDLALDTLGALGAPVPKALKTPLKNALEAALIDTKQAAKAQPILRSLGYTPRQTGFLSRRTRIDE
ncbi:P-loop NTPase fold protein [Nocardia tengchongensis]|uniref:P-loop NTPase fold protein n=1 Tax=Nocardia tengchongensis TaxID=2055889 RepID=UPI00367FCADE